MPACYRHPSRETGVSCSNCGRPICPDCMTPTPVGMRCPECSRQRTQVRTLRNVPSGVNIATTLIAINVAVYLLQISQGSGGLGSGVTDGSVYLHGFLWAPSIRFDHEYWRLVTGAFLHGSILHIGFNMYLLYVLGRMIEPALGPVRFASIYFVALLAGSLGELIAAPNSPTIGASGAVFGLMGAAVMEMRARGIDPMQSGLPLLIVINLALSFTSNHVSVGGHIGGLVGGALLVAATRRLPPTVALGVSIGLAAGLAVAGIVVADNSSLMAG